MYFSVKNLSGMMRVRCGSKSIFQRMLKAMLWYCYEVKLEAELNVVKLAKERNAYGY